MFDRGVPRPNPGRGCGQQQGLERQEHERKRDPVGDQHRAKVADARTTRTTGAKSTLIEATEPAEVTEATEAVEAAARTLGDAATLETLLFTALQACPKPCR